MKESTKVTNPLCKRNLNSKPTTYYMGFFEIILHYVKQTLTVNDLKLIVKFTNKWKQRNVYVFVWYLFFCHHSNNLLNLCCFITDTHSGCQRARIDLKNGPLSPQKVIESNRCTSISSRLLNREVVTVSITDIKLQCKKRSSLSNRYLTDINNL